MNFIIIYYLITGIQLDERSGKGISICSKVYCMHILVQKIDDRKKKILQIKTEEVKKIKKKEKMSPRSFQRNEGAIV